MSLAIWEPFLTREFFDRPFLTKDSYISNMEKEILLELDAPGMRAEDIQVSVDKDVLLIEGKSEARRRSFSKRYVVPETVDESGISARLVDGILSVTLPKREVPAARKISVLAA